MLTASAQSSLMRACLLARFLMIPRLNTCVSSHHSRSSEILLVPKIGASRQVGRDTTSHLKDIAGSDGSELSGRRIALCVTGSVSITEAPRIARTLMRHGAEVIPVLTNEAMELVSPMIFEWSTGNSPITKITGRVEHVELVNSSNKVDLILIAPCTANTLSKIASGICDDAVSLLLCTALGVKTIPILIAPSMHEPMVTNPLIQQSIARLEGVGVRFVAGRLEESKSKLASAEEILKEVIMNVGNGKERGGGGQAKSPYTKQEKEGEGEGEGRGRETGSQSQGQRTLSFLITAGPTREPIDEVRFITNASSGKMGVALAQEASRRGGGGDVCLIHGPGVKIPQENQQNGIRSKEVITTKEMLDSVLEELDRERKKFDVFISAAAPADYSPVESYQGKLSTSKNKTLTIELNATKKIIKAVKEKYPSIFVVAFKAEYDPHKLVQSAKQTLKESGADVVVANDVSRNDIGFGSEYNEVIIVSRKKGRKEEQKEGQEERVLSKSSKAEIARGIFDFIFEQFQK